MSDKTGTKKGSKARKRFLIVLIIICAAVFAISAYMLISYYLEGAKVKADYDEIRQEVSDNSASDAYKDMLAAYLALHNKNEDFVAWLYMPGANIDYPVMQTPGDPEYYLRRNFNKQYSTAGTVFASNISDLTKPSDVIILYGHMMKNSSMFGGLKQYTDQNYFNEHRNLRLDTLTCRREYEAIAVFKTDVTVYIGDDGKETSKFPYYSYSDFKDEADFEKFMNMVKKYQVFDSTYTASPTDKLILLSTCEYSQENGRLVIVAREVRTEDAAGNVETH